MIKRFCDSIKELKKPPSLREVARLAVTEGAHGIYISAELFCAALSLVPPGGCLGFGIRFIGSAQRQRKD